MTTKMRRKQIYMDAEREQKLRAVADTLGVSEAEVVRRAIDELAERFASPREMLRERLRAAGLLMEWPAIPKRTAEESEAAERWLDEWARANPEPWVDKALDEDRGEW